MYKHVLLGVISVQKKKTEVFPLIVYWTFRSGKRRLSVDQANLRYYSLVKRSLGLLDFLSHKNTWMKKTALILPKSAPLWGKNFKTLARKYKNVFKCFEHHNIMFHFKITNMNLGTYSSV